MNSLAVLVEGETEQAFVRNQLVGHLVTFGVQAFPVPPGKQGRLRGVRKWAGTQADLERLLKRPGTFVTTMFDFYGMPTDWPGRSEAAKLKHGERAESVELAVAEQIQRLMGGKFDPRRFIPYVQLHEFEALMFASPEVLADTLAPLSTRSAESLTRYFTGIVEEAGAPEWINDNYDTCPSRRITSKVRSYRKPAQGSIVTERIGLPTLREQCKHFASWIDQLEAIGTATT